MRTFGKIIFSIAVIFLGFNLLMTLNGVSRNKAYADYGDLAYLEDDYEPLKKVFDYYHNDFLFEVDEDDFFIKVISGAVYKSKNGQNGNFIIVYLGNKNLNEEAINLEFKFTTENEYEENSKEPFKLVALNKDANWYMQIIDMNTFLNEEKELENIVKMELSYNKDEIIKTYEGEKLLSVKDYDILTILENEEDLSSLNIIKTGTLTNLKKYRWINWVGMLSYLVVVFVLVYFIYLRKMFKSRRPFTKEEPIKEVEVINTTKTTKENEVIDAAKTNKENKMIKKDLDE